jgi:hypothetical protein
MLVRLCFIIHATVECSSRLILRPLAEDRRQDQGNDQAQVDNTTDKRPRDDHRQVCLTRLAGASSGSGPNGAQSCNLPREARQAFAEAVVDVAEI